MTYRLYTRCEPLAECEARTAADGWPAGHASRGHRFRVLVARGPKWAVGIIARGCTPELARRALEHKVGFLYPGRVFTFDHTEGK